MLYYWNMRKKLELYQSLKYYISQDIKNIFDYYHVDAKDNIYFNNNIFVIFNADLSAIMNTQTER